nr:hypothetical protein [Tanacetum cinerariifolium]
MDENTMRLWLKDHQDTTKKLAQQQAMAFQVQLDALRAELQVTRRLLQNRQGAGVKKGRSYRGLCGRTFCGLLVSTSKNHFGPLKYEDLREALSKLLWVRLRIINLLVSKPTTLGDAFSLARITRARLEDQAALTFVTIAKPSSNIGNQRQLTPRLGGLQ